MAPRQSTQIEVGAHHGAQTRTNEKENRMTQNHYKKKAKRTLCAGAPRVDSRCPPFLTTYLFVSSLIFLCCCVALASRFSPPFLLPLFAFIFFVLFSFCVWRMFVFFFCPYSGRSTLSSNPLAVPPSLCGFTRRKRREDARGKPASRRPDLSLPQLLPPSAACHDSRGLVEEQINHRHTHTKNNNNNSVDAGESRLWGWETVASQCLIFYSHSREHPPFSVSYRAKATRPTQSFFPQLDPTLATAPARAFDERDVQALPSQVR